MKKTPKNENKTNKSTKYILSLIGGTNPKEREVILQEIKTFLVVNAENIKNIKLNLIRQHLDAINKIDEGGAKQAKQAYLNDLIKKFREGNKLYEYETVQFDNYEQNDVAEFSTKNLLLSVVRSLYSIYYSYNKNDVELNNKNEEFKFVYSEPGTEVKKTVDANGKAPAPAPVSNEDNEDQLLEGAIDLDVVGIPLGTAELTETSTYTGETLKLLEEEETRRLKEEEGRLQKEKEAEEERLREENKEAEEERLRQDKLRISEEILDEKQTLDELKINLEHLLTDDEKEKLEERTNIIKRIKNMKDEFSTNTKDREVVFQKSKDKLEAEIEYKLSVDQLETHLQENAELLNSTILKQLEDDMMQKYNDYLLKLQEETNAINKKIENKESLIKVLKKIRDRKTKQHKEPKIEPTKPTLKGSVLISLKNELNSLNTKIKKLYDDKNNILKQGVEAQSVADLSKKSTPNILDSAFDLLPGLLNISNDEEEVEEEVEEVVEEEVEEEVEEDGEEKNNQETLVALTATNLKHVVENREEDLNKVIGTIFSEIIKVVDNNNVEDILKATDAKNKAEIAIIAEKSANNDLQQFKSKSYQQKNAIIHKNKAELTKKYYDSNKEILAINRELLKFKFKLPRNISNKIKGFSVNQRNLETEAAEKNLESIKADLNAHKSLLIEKIEAFKSAELKIQKFKPKKSFLSGLITLKKAADEATKFATDLSNRLPDIKSRTDKLKSNNENTTQEGIDNLAKIDNFMTNFNNRLEEAKQKATDAEKKATDAEQFINNLKTNLITASAEAKRTKEEKSIAEKIYKEIKERFDEATVLILEKKIEDLRSITTDINSNLKKNEELYIEGFLNKKKRDAQEEYNKQKKLLEEILQKLNEPLPAPPEEQSQQPGGGKLAKYKSTRDEVYILYKKRRYKKTVYVKENTKTKYCKINSKFYMLSKLKVIG